MQNLVCSGATTGVVAPNMSILNHNFKAPGADAVSFHDEVLSGKRSALVQSFKDWSLSAKLRSVVLGAGLLPFLVVGILLGQFAYFGMAGVNHSERVAAEVRVGQAALSMSQVARELSDAKEQGNEAYLASAITSVARAQDKMNEAIELGRGRYPEETIAEMIKERDIIAVKAREVEQLTLDASPQTFARLQSQARQCARNLDATFKLVTRHAVKSIDDLINGIVLSFVVCVALTLAAIIISAIGVRAMIAHIVGQITDITGAMKKLAEGDVKSPIPGGDRRDEIGDMARSLAVFRNSSFELRELNDARARDAEVQLAQQQLVAQQMRDLRNEKSQLLEGLADAFEVSVGDLITAVSAASNQLKSTSHEMVSLAAGSSEQAGSASEAMQSSADNVQAAAAATDEFALSIGEISRQAAASAQLARGASDLVDEANTKMTDLSQAAVEVGAIVELIQTIAQRTNLLALNASIEAARGGEAGRGFAVVASEVKELAMQTSNAANSVTYKISAMQNSTQSSADDLASIVKRIGELEQTAVMIASAVDEQSVSATDLARNIDKLAGDSSQVSSRLGLLRTSSEETGTAANDVVSGAQALGSHADELRIKATDFIHDVRRSARDLETRETGPDVGLTVG